MASDPRVHQLLEEACRDCPDVLLGWQRLRSNQDRIGAAPRAGVRLGGRLYAGRSSRRRSDAHCRLPGGGSARPRRDGVVYRARDSRLHRPVALKMLLAGPYARPGGGQLLQEAAATAGLRHPNIVRLWDAHAYREMALLPQGIGCTAWRSALTAPPWRRAAATPSGYGTSSPDRSRRAAGARVLRQRCQFQPGRYPAGHRFRRHDVANLGHGSADGAGGAAGRHLPATRPGLDNKPPEAGPVRRSPAARPAG